MKSVYAAKAAWAAFHTGPSQTLFDAKRLTVREYDDSELKRDRKRWPFKILHKGGKPMIQVKSKSELIKDFEISAMAPTKMKQTARAYLSQKVTHSVVTVLANFNDAHHLVTKDAGNITGSIVLHIAHKTTTAARSARRFKYLIPAPRSIVSPCLYERREVYPRLGHPSQSPVYVNSRVILGAQIDHFTCLTGEPDSAGSHSTLSYEARSFGTQGCGTPRIIDLWMGFWIVSSFLSSA
ncbi:ATPase with role in protein import into the ER [Ceratobasidium sp. 395]|nr:ATPase with role in protein import into the ER [Ceratobasidium sp. 395]